MLGVLRFVALLRTHRRFHRADKRRRHRHRDNAQNDDLEVVLHKRNAAEEITHEHEQAYPRNATNGVEQGELTEIHVARAAMNGANVRKNGMKRVMTMVRPPYFAKKLTELGHALGRECP